MLASCEVGVSLHYCLCQNITQHHDKCSRGPFHNTARERAIDQIRHLSIESDRPQLSLAVLISHSDTDADMISSEMTISRLLHPQPGCINIPGCIRHKLNIIRREHNGQMFDPGELITI